MYSTVRKYYWLGVCAVALPIQLKLPASDGSGDRPKTPGSKADVSKDSPAKTNIGKVTTSLSIGQGAGVNYPLYNKDGRLEANLRGASVEPIGGNQLHFRQLHIETFNEDGTPNLVGDAPDCIYSLSSKTVTSSGLLNVVQSSGSFRVTGEGFLWEQVSGRLVISNQAHTVFRLSDSALSHP